MQLIRDKVPEVASRYVKRDFPALLEKHSPLRQVAGQAPPETGESLTPPKTRSDGAKGDQIGGDGQ